MLPLQGQSRSGSNGNERVLCIPQSTNITRTSPSDCLVSYPGHSLWGGGVLPLCRGAVSAFYSPSQLGNKTKRYEVSRLNSFHLDYYTKLWQNTLVLKCICSLHCVNSCCVQNTKLEAVSQKKKKKKDKSKSRFEGLDFRPSSGSAFIPSGHIWLVVFLWPTDSGGFLLSTDCTQTPILFHISQHLLVEWIFPTSEP